MDSIIKLDNVSFCYENDDIKYPVLENLSAEFEEGSFNVILGHNGSGKSTIAKLLNGLIKPVSGTVTVNGMSTLDEKYDFEIKKTVGMVFQNPDNQLVSSVVEEDVAFGPENLGLEPDEIRHRVDSALKAVGMYDFRRASTHKLSGGQKQRVAIAGVIAMQPKCLVLDEPTAMLDPRGRKEVIDTVIRLNKEKNITVILITHFMEEAQLSDRVIVLSNGKIISDGNPNSVFCDTEKLHQAGLSVPQTTDLLAKLSDSGINVTRSSISPDDCAQTIIEAISKA
ncbi:MAG: energy-coupling factor transporter ATPase [Clostridia bacterium]|nr:energy-coupling factor transporter ATPase [Clostridia bacterium]